MASRISRAGNRHLRRALYMPALVGSRCDPHAKAFFENLLARKKARRQALIAVARKLLHAIYGIFRSGLKYEGTKLFPQDHFVLTGSLKKHSYFPTDPYQTDLRS